MKSATVKDLTWIDPGKDSHNKDNKENGENGENEICSYEENSQKIDTIVETTANHQW